MKKERKSYRICLNCRHMKHSKHDYYCGKCMYDSHSIDNIRNHDWCSHWSCDPVDEYNVVYTGIAKYSWQ